MNELTISTVSTPAKFSFKNAKLNEISAKIAEQSAVMNSVYNAAKEGAETVNKALAPLFGELLTTKCFKDDGFKSVADYAEQTFGMSKSMAYMLARVGEQFYNTDNDYTRKARETLSTSKLAELTGTDRVAIAKAIDDGELASDTPLAICRDFATSHKTPGKEKVIPIFDLYAVHPSISGGKVKTAESVMKDEFKDKALSYCGMDSGELVSVKFDGDKASAGQHFVVVSPTGVSFMFEYRPHVKPVSKGKGKGEKFDLAAYIASLSPDERKALADMVAGNS